VINLTLVVVFDVDSVGRRVIRETIGAVADILYLTDVPAAERAAVLRRAEVIFAQNTAKDLTTDELSLIRTVRLVQFYTAGVDFIPLQALPAECPIATNGGAFAEPMAEHALALARAAAKRLFIEHHHLAHGVFHQLSLSRLNHRLPRIQAHPEVMQRTTEFHHQIADPLLPQMDAVLHDAAALDTPVDMLDVQPPLVERMVRPLLLPRERLAAGFHGMVI
jgi:lactate dehydrogenase-like 2-hydroxyacid dehydrogenase